MLSSQSSSLADLQKYPLINMQSADSKIVTPIINRLLFMLLTNARFNYAKIIQFYVLSLVLSIAYGCQSLSNVAQNVKTPLMNNLGGHHYPISTSKPLAQRYFDQGLVLAFGFNHAEAARSFRQASLIDPDCAMCYWGEALVLGPNLNAPMASESISLAVELSSKAIELADRVTAKESALIQALGKRYAVTKDADRLELDQAYANAMRSVARTFLDDPVVTSLCAEALMDLHPWDFWTKQGRSQPWTAEIVAVLEHALHLNPDNPLANHLYIHAMEASPYAERALPSAQRLSSLVPGSGHLVHMPAHIYIRLGRYRDAILANQRAVRIDHDYLSHDHKESLYTLAYVPHNHHFIWASAIKTGRKTLARKAAIDTSSMVDQDQLREQSLSGTLQHFLSIPLVTNALFGDWQGILKQPRVDEDLRYLKGIEHYTRALALLRTGKIKQAKAELIELETIIADPLVADLTVFGLNSASALLSIGANIVYGELSAEARDIDRAVKFLERAVVLEDALNYTEPKDWYLPPRQVLGAVLLESGRNEAAERIYRQDLAYHPQNGWSLFGLVKSLQTQGKSSEADEVQQQFNEVWAEADFQLTGSRM